jgi:hypothetical protein
MKNLRIYSVILVLLIVVVFAAGNAHAVKESGYISELYATGSYSFTVNAGSDPLVEVTFSYPRGTVDFHVTVTTGLGLNEQVKHTEYDLDEVDVIPLRGGGVFHVTVWSNEGTGNWSAEYYVDSNGNCPKWPDQMSRYLTSAELNGCTCWELRILRNEIYARHGRKFKSEDLQDYFFAQPWYSIDPNNLNGDKGQNDFEKRNNVNILKEERSRGCR